MIRQSLITSLFLGSLLTAAQTWTLTTTQFETKPVTVKKFAEDRAEFSVGADPLTMAVDQVLSMESTVKRTDGSGLILNLTNGDKIVGTPQKLTSESLVFSSSGLGDIEVPVARIAGLFRAKSIAMNPNAKRTEDMIRLTNGDTVSGILSDMDGKTITIQKADGSTAPVGLDSVDAVYFATTPPVNVKNPDGKLYRVLFASGSQITCTDLAFDGDTIQLTPVGGKSAKVDQGQVVSIERLNGAVVWLSTRTPTENIQTPFLDASFPARMDRSVMGDTIRFGQQTFARGIGVHSKSRITFAIESGDTALRTRYAIDGQLTYADVDVRIYIDDKVVHETKGFKSGILSDAVQIDLTGGKMLTLEVDYGKGYDVQDRLNWIEPAIIRR